MRQVVLEKPGELLLGGAPLPSPGPNEALVRVRRVGVCGTDYHAFEGNQPFFEYPRILGHEFAAEIVEAPANGRGLKPGDRCAVEPYMSCGACHPCRAGKPNCCESIRVFGVHMDGGMREFIAAPLARLHKSEKLSFEQLTLVEPLGIGAHAVARSGLGRGEDVLVIGAGPIGLAVMQFAEAAGARVRGLEINPGRRDFARRFGFETLEAADDKLADLVFDATGNAASMEQSLQRVAFGGKLVFVGLVQSAVALDDVLFHRREITLFASRNSVNEFPRIIRMMEEGAIDSRPWITHRLTLDEVPARFPDLPRDPSCIKALIEVSS